MLFTYTACPDCGGLTACYCYTPGRQIADQYADVLTHLHAVLDGFGQYRLNDRICEDLFLKPLKPLYNEAADFRLNRIWQDLFLKPLYRQWRDGRNHHGC